jgi:hypothetical protein
MRTHGDGSLDARRCEPRFDPASHPAYGPASGPPSSAGPSSLVADGRQRSHPAVDWPLVCPDAVPPRKSSKRRTLRTSSALPRTFPDCDTFLEADT